jgi:hypothetical protein
VTARPEAVIADAGYWHTAQIEAIGEREIEVLRGVVRIEACGPPAMAKTHRCPAMWTRFSSSPQQPRRRRSSLRWPPARSRS